MTMTEKRRYFIATVALFVALVAVVVWPSPKGDPLADAKAAQVTEQQKAQEPTGHRQYRSHSGSRHKRDTIDWDKVYANGTPYHSKYDDFKVELNTADTSDLKELRGIGSAFARRITKYRDLLGGYQSKEQLMEVYGMTDTLYGMIAPHIEVDPSKVEKIDLNSATVDQMKRHPYLDYYQAKALVKYRERMGSFTSKEQMLDIPLIDQATFNRIEKYITIKI